MRKFLGEILLEMEAVTDLQVKAALNKQNAGDKRMIGQLLVEAQACSPEDVARALAEQFDMRFYDLESMEVPRKIVDLVPQELGGGFEVMKKIKRVLDQYNIMNPGKQSLDEAYE